MTWRIEQGDSLDVLAGMPDCSVQCVVTSPPYWGLRDYGTATWEGGDTGCDHKNLSYPSGRDTPGGRGGSMPQSEKPYRDTCRKCGARRIDNQLGLEPTPDEYVAKMVEIFREQWRVLRDDGVMFLNMGDGYAGSWGDSGHRPERSGAPGHQRQKNTQYFKREGHPQANRPVTVSPPGLKPKDLVGMPWRLAFALRADGWWLRSDIIWHKPNPMPENCTDRPTKAHEYVFLLTKKANYYYDQEAIREEAQYGYREHTGEMRSVAQDGRRHTTGTTRGGDPSAGRNKRSVWTIPTQGFTGWTQTCRLVPVGRDDVCDDMMRITSQDCPRHEGLPDRVPRAFHDERVAGHLIRILRTHGRRAPEHASGCVLLGWLREHCFEHDSSDSLAPLCSETAIQRSNQNRKKGLVLETNQPCSVSVQMSGRIGDRLGPPGSCDSVARSPASNTSEGDSSDVMVTDPSGQKPDRSEGIGKCSCHYYTTKTEEVSHFATFPEKLVEPCIRAGTSAHGCCPKCAAPWRRVVDKERVRTRPGRDSKSYDRQTGEVIDDGIEKPWRDRAEIGNRDPGRHVTESTTVGWLPTCQCFGNRIPRSRNQRKQRQHDAWGQWERRAAAWAVRQKFPLNAGVVMDPFCGSGTTGVVALRLGQDFIGIELNPEYIEMAERRITQDAPLLNAAGSGG